MSKFSEECSFFSVFLVIKAFCRHTISTATGQESYGRLLFDGGIRLHGLPLLLKLMNYMCTEGTEPFLYSTLNQIYVHVILIDRPINIFDVRQNLNRCL